MKKVLICLLILLLICSLPIVFFGCAHKGAELYKPKKFKESIDLTNYTLVFSDDFDGELDHSIWGDTRQGTRRDGFWTKNLAFTENGNLIIRTEVRGSRYCSDTHVRKITGHNGSTVTVKYDDCNPFAVLAGDYDKSAIQIHTQDAVGYVILNTFNELAENFVAWKRANSEDELLAPSSTKNALYASFFEKASRLFSYYSFVAETKAVATEQAYTAVIGANYDRSILSYGDLDLQNVDLQEAVARLFGFSEKSEFTTLANALADLCKSDPSNATIANGGFLTANGCCVFPVAFSCGEFFVLTHVIAESDGSVSVWVNDLRALLKATNYNASYDTGKDLSVETYCKNVLFVTGPEGVYSGALRTMDTYTHGYGYYEIRCKLPSVEGIWHAFWMMCGDVYSVGNGSTDGVEIDVFEYLPALDAVNCALHWDGYDEAHQNAHKRYEKTKLADGKYHTFGTLWDENGYAFYIDNKKVWSTTGGGVCPLDGYMKISTEYGEWGEWVGTLDLKDLPVDWVIDYVKIYDKVSA